MDRTESSSTVDAPASFEDAQAELDELVRAMETGQMPLDRLLSAYKRGSWLCIESKNDIFFRRTRRAVIEA